MTRGARGFTLVELIIALALVGALLVTAFGGLRMAVGAWQRGDERAEAQQHIRGLTVALGRAIGGTHPYNGPRRQGETPALLFEGTATRIEFVTHVPPFPVAVPAAFTAVVIELRRGERPGLVVSQRILPNHEPFERAVPVLEDATVTAVTLGYLGLQGWQDTWNPESDNGLPQAVRISIETTQLGGRPLPPLTVAIGGPR
jgi:general secretion pathway protein J